MTQRTWNGTTGQFSDPTKWLPNGVPVDGDTAIINSGTVNESGALPANFLLQLNGGNGSSPTINMTDALILAGSHLALVANQADASVVFSGASVNQGSIDLSGANPGSALITLTNTGSTAPTLTNSGGINIVGVSAIVQTTSTVGGAQLVNNGVISIRNPGGASVLSTTDFVAISGTGSIRLGDKVSFAADSLIGSGQTIQFEPGSTTASTLQIGGAAFFQGTISGFGALDKITTVSALYDSFSYVSTGTNTGNLVFTASGTAVSTLAFIGSYATSSFTITTQTGATQELSTIQTTVPDLAQSIAYTDVVTNISAADTVLPYSDPNVPYLQYTYQWAGTDAVAIRASVSNVFLKGGPSGDALQAFGGNNVLDGGGGSNFLIGATGSDGGSDVFFVDGRNQVNTWSTIVNFHVGDIAVIFGFKQGTSTAPWIASDGAAGYTGATLHSELNGAGTGVNESMTFTGISLATEAGFQVSYGTAAAQGNDYIMVKYV
jgi:hypothetical protein